MKKSKWIIVVVAVAFLCNVSAVILRLDFWTGLFAPVFDLLAVGMIFHAIFTSANKQFRLNFILAGAAVLTWAIADTLWFIFDQLFFIDPDSIDLITILYFGTNVFLVATSLIYIYSRLRKWDTVQLVLDGFIFSTAILWLIWVLMYDKDVVQMGRLLTNSILNTASILMDVFLLIIIGIWYLSIRKGVLPAFLRIMGASVFLFSLIDLAYYNLYSRNLYIPGSFLDLCYLAVLFGIALSIKMYYLKYPSNYVNEHPHTNVGTMHKGLILVIFPVIIVIFHTIDSMDVALYFVLIVIHEASSDYIQKSIRDRALLGQEKDMTKKLEQLVSEKTQDLQSAIGELQKRNEELSYLNIHDPLTGLYNRTYFLEQVGEAIDTAVPGEKVAMLLWNVDNLKGINDTYGLATGDKVLTLLSNRIRKLLEGAGILARMTGDEFAYLFKGEFANQEFIHTAEQVVRACQEPLQIDGYSFLVTVSVGISLYPVCATDKRMLLKNADIAMQYAKVTQPDSHIAKYADIDTAMERKSKIGNYLMNAEYNRDLQLYFQPQFRTTDRKLVGMEALLRWTCPEIGPVSPAEFIPIAEAENLIIPIGNWVIENAVSRISNWNSMHQMNLRIGINISPKQFDQAGTFTVLDASIQRYQAKPEWIDIEITEGVALDNENGAENIKRHIRSKGMSVSIDDFGTGYSSLGYLSILSFDRLKIAKPLIDKITFDKSSRKIVNSIILLAKSLDLVTIAEGVETKEQFSLLKSLGCDQIQGFYLGEPVPADEFEKRFLLPAAEL